MPKNIDIENKYKSHRIIDKKVRLVIVNDVGMVINDSPSREELKGLKTEDYKRNSHKTYTDKELLNFLKLFYQENNRIPTIKDFSNNSKYPGYSIYRDRFGSWNNSLILAELDQRAKCSNGAKYTDEDMLNFLKLFYQENNRIPVRRDFENNSKYPGFYSYYNHFGSWNNALRLAEMDIDTMARQKNFSNNIYKGRHWEIMIMDMFQNKSIDLSGNNCNSPFDGICPNGKTYDAKSSKLYDNDYWLFPIYNKDKETIEWYYFGAFNKDYTELLHVWQVPGEVIENNYLYVGKGTYSKFNMENMKEYEITDRFKEMAQYQE